MRKFVLACCTLAAMLSFSTQTIAETPGQLEERQRQAAAAEAEARIAEAEARIAKARAEKAAAEAQERKINNSSK